MRVKLLLPYKQILDKEALKISAPGLDGDFQIKPRHVDFTWTLVPGILEIYYEDGLDIFAIDSGVLVKKKDQVFIGVFRAVEGNSLEELNQSVSELFKEMTEREKEARVVLTRLETETLKKFMELEK